MVIIIIFAFKCSPFCKMKGVFVCNILFVKILCRILIFGSNPPASASETNYLVLLDKTNGAIFFAYKPTFAICNNQHKDFICNKR